MKKTASLLFVFVFFLLFLCPVFAFAEEGSAMPVLEPLPDSVSGKLHAKSYVLMDRDTGAVLAASNENTLLYPASVTKIMSLLLVSEAIEAGKLTFDKKLTCSATAAAKGGSQIWLKEGEEMTVRDLLKATAVYSANDACTLLGEAVAGSETAFVGLMNQKAQALGMKDTHFDNCTGLDDDTETHLTTAYDVALMSRALMNVGFITDYTTIWMDTLRGGETQLVNTNRLIRFYPGAVGLKTGTTAKAGCCISAVAERDGMCLIAVVMGAANSNERFDAARLLLDHGFSQYEVFTPSLDPAAAGIVTVRHGKQDTLKLNVSDGDAVLLKKGQSAEVHMELSVEQIVEAPVEKGTKLGGAVFYVGDRQIAQLDLTAAQSVDRLSFFDALGRIFQSFFYKS